VTPPVSPERYDAVLFDLDGVITATAHVHASAWKRMFDEYLEARAASLGEQFRPFTEDDYLNHIDGRPRYDGVRTFLASREIELPEGDPSDPPDRETVCGLGNRKDELFNQVLDSEGVEVYDGSVRFLHWVRDQGMKTAVVTSSKNRQAVVAKAGLEDMFDTSVDGITISNDGLPGKPAPDCFLEAARRLEVEPERAVVVEDAISGVAAGEAGGFGLVIGVDRLGVADELRQAGADLVVTDLGSLVPQS
jgi:beta-phosphoglucomutase family hydrolase